jgi:uncharacterized protein YaeQ
MATDHGDTRSGDRPAGRVPLRKAARRVALFGATELPHLEREAATRKIHDVENIEVWLLEPRFLDALEQKLEKSLALELVRSSGVLYVTLPGGDVLESPLTETRLGR